MVWKHASCLMDSDFFLRNRLRMRIAVDANGFLAFGKIIFILLSDLYTYFKEQNSYAKEHCRLIQLLSNI